MNPAASAPGGKQPALSPGVGCTHTPGPWSVGNRYGRSRTEIVAHDGNMALATVWTHKPTADHSVDEASKEGLANLRLIAAAPDMFEALERVCDAYGFDPSIDSSIWQDAFAALARARGEA